MDYEELKALLIWVVEKNGVDRTQLNTGFLFKLYLVESEFEVFKKMLKDMSVSEDPTEPEDSDLPYTFNYNALIIPFVGGVIIKKNHSTDDSDPILKWYNKDEEECLKVLEPFIY